MSLRSKALVEIAIKAETADGPLADALRALVEDLTAASEEAGPYVFGSDVSGTIFGVPEWLRAGSALATNPTAIKVIMARSETVRTFSVSHEGDSANVAGQTVSYDVYRNAVLILGATAILPAAGGTHIANATLAIPASLVAGDTLEVILQPLGANLANPVTRIRLTVN